MKQIVNETQYHVACVNQCDTSNMKPNLKTYHYADREPAVNVYRSMTKDKSFDGQQDKCFVYPNGSFIMFYRVSLQVIVEVPDWATKTLNILRDYEDSLELAELDAVEKFVKVAGGYHNVG